MIRKLRFAYFLPLPLALAFFVTSCDLRPKSARKPKTEKKKEEPSVDSRFDEARTKLMEGKFADAAKDFNDIGKVPNVRQPLQNWNTVMEGLALLLDGQEPASRKVFAELAARGPFSEKEEDVLLAKFFVTIGTALGSDKAIPADAANNFDKWTFEGIAFLLYGLKDWNLEKPEDAVPLLRKFADVSPEKMVAWASGPPELQRLQEISESCVSDYQEGRPALQALYTATSVEAQADALEKAKAARAKMKLTTKVSKELDAKIAELSPKVAGQMAEKSKMASDDIANDEKLLPAAKEKRLALHAKGMYREAQQAMLDPNLKTEPAKDEQALLAKKSSWLGNFKEQLIEDLKKTPYNGPVNGKNGQPLANGVLKADDQQLILLTSKGQLPVTWGDVAPASIYAIGKSYISDDLPPQIMAFRKWHLGVFGSYAKVPESMQMLKDAAEIRSLFAEELPLFEKQTDTW